MKRFLAVMAFTVALAGCSSDSEGEQMVRTGDARPSQSSDGRLDRDPSPLTLQDVRRFPVESPERAVMQLLFWAQWGSAPNVAAAYDPVITDRLGVTFITAPYAWLRPQLVVSRPRIVSHTANARGEFIGVELASKSYPFQRDSFSLRRGAGGRWFVVYDTLAERGLQAMVTENTAKNPAKPGHAALAAGKKAAQNFRDTGTSILLGG
jgi:hypothetical protein